jgi:hypothetical protein
MLNEAYLKKPGLFLFSDNDSISTPDMNAFVLNNWTKMGVPVSNLKQQCSMSRPLLLENPSKSLTACLFKIDFC